ncbi:MAG TPA: excinuclease ABC subunit UvrA [Usitatibacter sp.]|nr:excinuclease ABC subunit UvrA [Usitatibacter sp.]
MSLEVPRDALVVFTGVSGSGKSSLAFGTLYAEAQRRYLESVAPYARRLFHQLGVPEVDEIEGLPPAVALQQQRGTPTTRSSVGSVTTLSNLLRMLYSRAGDYPPKQPLLYAESFSPNTPEGACPECHGLGRVYDVTEATMVPDPSLTIREKAVAAWPGAWQGQNLRDILTALHIDIDVPWRDLPKKTRDWILFTEETPSIPVYAHYTMDEVKRAQRKREEPSYMGTFTGARRYVRQTFANTQSAMMKRRVAQFMAGADCRTCAGKRLRPESLSVKFADLDIAEMSRLPLKRLGAIFHPYARGEAPALRRLEREHPEKAEVMRRISHDICARLEVLLDLGLGYLALERSTPTLSPGELQRLRLATQVRSNLFGVVYVLDEPSAGLHPSDTEALLRALDRLKASGNSIFVVEHELDVIRHADWIVDVGPGAGQHGGEILYSGPLAGLRKVEGSRTARALWKRDRGQAPNQANSQAGACSPERAGERVPSGHLSLRGVTRNNLTNLDVDIPLGVFTSVTGVSGSGKSTLVSQVLVELVAAQLGHRIDEDDEADPLAHRVQTLGGHIEGGLGPIKRLIRVDQRPIGRTPRSNLATYTGLFDHVRELFARTPAARARRYDAGRFSFNVAKGRCENCEGEGFVMVELLFLPSVYSPCPVCRGTRFNAKTLEVEYRGRNVAEVLRTTVDEAWEFFGHSPRPSTEAEADHRPVVRALEVLREVGLGYLRLGQPATELSGGEAQRIKLATELQRAGRGNSLYVLDEPTTGLHPADVDRLMRQLQALVEAGNTVVVVEHDMQVIAASDWVIDMGPGAGDEGGNIVARGRPYEVARAEGSRTARYLRSVLEGTTPTEETMAAKKGLSSEKTGLARKAAPAKAGAESTPNITPAPFPGESPTVSLAMAAGKMYGHAAPEREHSRDKPSRGRGAGSKVRQSRTEPPRRAKTQRKSPRSGARSGAGARRAKP